ncbi:hypothetical protein HID58_064875 [Brassica napus]|uniref:Uncharacterized protein n=1 Tax=Brassica napus TaxID=3708 RepID=A0ABQ7ZB81_BRANA|nr:hypothetical protein HID58_064875 [Brassica napus]
MTHVTTIAKENTPPSPKRLEIPHSPSMHHHHLISNHRRASIEQFESSSVTSST